MIYTCKYISDMHVMFLLISKCVFERECLYSENVNTFVDVQSPSRK